MYEVAPFAGAWIEISLWNNFNAMLQSLPSRGRGLKSYFRVNGTVVEGSRSLRGGVD